MGQRSGGNPQAFARWSPPSRSPAPRWEVLPAGGVVEQMSARESRPLDQDDKAWGAYHRRAPRITAGACSRKDLHSHSAYRYCRSRRQTTKEVSIGSLPRPSASPLSGGALPLKSKASGVVRRKPSRVPQGKPNRVDRKDPAGQSEWIQENDAPPHQSMLSPPPEFRLPPAGWRPHVQPPASHST